MIFSFRDAAQELDPVRPPDRLRGDGSGSGRTWYADSSIQRWFAGDDSSFLDQAPERQRFGLAHQKHKGINELIRWAPDERSDTDPVSLRKIAQRHTSRSSALRLLWLNTWLINPPLSGNDPLDRGPRAKEISKMLARSNYAIMGLCEVFEEEDQKRISSELAAARAINTGLGPKGAGIEIGSGLMTVTDGALPLGSINRKVYKHDGGGDPDDILGEVGDAFGDFFDIFDGANALSQKGILHAQILLDASRGLRLDFFTTHLHSKDSEARSEQVDELIAFVRQHRSNENVALVAGDFNIDIRSSEYPSLVRRMSALGLYDLALSNGGTAASTHEIFDYAAICPISSRRSPDGTVYCDDYEAEERSTDAGTNREDVVPGYRLDYIFIEQPTSSHRYDLDVGRLRRCPFPRDQANSTIRFKDVTKPFKFTLQDGRVIEIPRFRPNFLSDHLGLEVPLWVTPREQ